MLSDYQRSGPNYTCTNYGGLPKKEQAIRRLSECRLLREGSALLRIASNARPIRVKLRAHVTSDFGRYS